jgi:Glycosyltransferase like family 2
LTRATRQPAEMTVIIPFKDLPDMTLTCVRSLLRYVPTSWGPLQIILVNNGSSMGALATVIAGVGGQADISIVNYDRPFNFQKMNNWAVELYATSPLVFLLNNDVEFVPPSTRLLGSMLSAAQRPDVGAVGALLLYGDGRTIQHAGVRLVPGAYADHPLAGSTLASIVDPRTSEMTLTSGPVIAVTAAAMMVRRECFDAVGGFDERFQIGGGDVDLCLRLKAAGFTNWLATDGYLLHHESISRAAIRLDETDFIQSYRTYVRHIDWLPTESGARP